MQVTTVSQNNARRLGLSINNLLLIRLHRSLEKSWSESQAETWTFWSAIPQGEVCGAAFGEAVKVVHVVRGDAAVVERAHGDGLGAQTVVVAQDVQPARHDDVSKRVLLGIRVTMTSACSSNGLGAQAVTVAQNVQLARHDDVSTQAHC